MNDDLPFRSIKEYPAHVNAPSVIARLLDSLGFRFYWATEGLRPGDYDFSPGGGCQSIGELIGHVWGLANWIALSVLGREEQLPKEPPTQRAHALATLGALRAHFVSLSDAELSAITIDDWPFWHMLNGPIADALTHVGQITSFRRLAGNPTPRAKLFIAMPPDD